MSRRPRRRPQRKRRVEPDRLRPGPRHRHLRRRRGPRPRSGRPRPGRPPRPPSPTPGHRPGGRDCGPARERRPPPPGSISHHRRPRPRRLHRATGRHRDGPGTGKGAINSAVRFRLHPRPRLQHPSRGPRHRRGPDARRDEVYVRSYGPRAGLPIARGPTRLLSPAALAAELSEASPALSLETAPPLRHRAHRRGTAAHSWGSSRRGPPWLHRGRRAAPSGRGRGAPVACTADLPSGPRRSEAARPLAPRERPESVALNFSTSRPYGGLRRETVRDEAANERARRADPSDMATRNVEVERLLPDTRTSRNVSPSGAAQVARRRRAARGQAAPAAQARRA